MRLRLQLALVLMAAVVCRAQIIDRMVAVVNRQVILQSDVEQAARVEFLLDGKPLDQLTAPATLQDARERLIDQALLQQQMVTTAQLDPTPEELAARLRDIRAQIAGAATDEKWYAMLAAYGVTEHDVEDQIVSQIRVLRFVDLRFRGLVRVDKTAIATYYQDVLVPELHKQGADVPPVDKVSSKISQILAEQRVNGLLNEWLQTLRSQTHIAKMNMEADAVSEVKPEMKPGAKP
jgi:peptidyl-prolyl cis-trans isomerase SurA